MASHRGTHLRRRRASNSSPIRRHHQTPRGTTAPRRGAVSKSIKRAERFANRLRRSGDRIVHHMYHHFDHNGNSSADDDDSNSSYESDSIDDEDGEEAENTNNERLSRRIYLAAQRTPSTTPEAAGEDKNANLNHGVAAFGTQRAGEEEEDDDDDDEEEEEGEIRDLPAGKSARSPPPARSNTAGLAVQRHIRRRPSPIAPPLLPTPYRPATNDLEPNDNPYLLRQPRLPRNPPHGFDYYNPFLPRARSRSPPPPYNPFRHLHEHSPRDDTSWEECNRFGRLPGPWGRVRGRRGGGGIRVAGWE